MSEPNYQELVKNALSNQLNSTFREIFDKIDEYIINEVNIDIKNDLLEISETIIEGFDKNFEEEEDITLNLTNNDSYRNSLELAIENAKTGTPATAAAPAQVVDEQKIETIKQNFNQWNNIKITVPKFFTRFLTKEINYDTLNKLANNYNVEIEIRIIDEEKNYNTIKEHYNNKMTEIIQKIRHEYALKINNLYTPLENIIQNIINHSELEHNIRADAINNKEVKITDLDKIIENINQIMENVNNLNNSHELNKQFFHLSSIKYFKQKFENYHNIIKKKDFSIINRDIKRNIVGELKEIIFKAYDGNVDIKSKNHPATFDRTTLQSIKSYIQNIEIYEQQLPNNLTIEGRKEIYDNISDFICKIILLFTHDNQNSIIVKLYPDHNATSDIKKLARTFKNREFQFKKDKDDIEESRSGIISGDYFNDFKFTLKNNDKTPENFNDSKELMTFFKIKWDDHYSSDYLKCIEENKKKEINLYIEELKQFFDDSKDNFKNIFSDLITLTQKSSSGSGSVSSDPQIIGNQFMQNIPNIEENWSNIIENLRYKTNLMNVLKEDISTRTSPPTPATAPASNKYPFDQHESDFNKEFNIDNHLKWITDKIASFTSSSPPIDEKINFFSLITETIRNLIYMLFHKIGRKVNKTIESVFNASSFNNEIKQFIYNPNNSILNEKLKKIVDSFFEENLETPKLGTTITSITYNVNGNSKIQEGNNIFLIYDCQDPTLSKNLMQTDYYKKKQEIKKLLKSSKNFVFESFYKILDETIDNLIVIQDDFITQSAVTATAKTSLKASGERFLKKYNLIGTVDVDISGLHTTPAPAAAPVAPAAPAPPKLITSRLGRTLRTIEGKNITVELKNISNIELKKFDDDNKIFFKLLDLLYIRSSRYRVGPINYSTNIREDERAKFFIGGGSNIKHNNSISNIENTYSMIGGLDLQIKKKFDDYRYFGSSARKYGDDPEASLNFIMYFLEITFGLQLSLKKLFSGYNINNILKDFFNLYIDKLYTVLKTRKMAIIVSNYSIYEIIRKVIMDSFEKFINEKILNSDKGDIKDSGDLDLSKDIILAKLSFSLTKLVDFFVDSFTNLDDVDDKILKTGSNNGLINYYNLKLGNIFNLNVEKKENLALISEELTKIFKVTDKDKKEINYLKFYREKIHKIDTLINNHKDETFGLLIEQIQDIIPGFTITEKGLHFENKDFEGLTIDTKQSDLERRKEELQKELAEIESRLSYAKKSE